MIINFTLKARHVTKAMDQLTERQKASLTNGALLQRMRHLSPEAAVESGLIENMVRAPEGCQLWSYCIRHPE